MMVRTGSSVGCWLLLGPWCQNSSSSCKFDVEYGEIHSYALVKILGTARYYHTIPKMAFVSRPGYQVLGWPLPITSRGASLAGVWRPQVPRAAPFQTIRVEIRCDPSAAHAALSESRPPHTPLSSASARIPIGGGVRWASGPIGLGARLEQMGTRWGICPMGIGLIGRPSVKVTRGSALTSF